MFTASNPEYYELINPVVTSARSSLGMLQAAGIPEAEALAKLIEYKMPYDLSEVRQQYPALVDTMSAIYELRYKSINYYLDKLDIDNIIDLGCGYSPRGIRYLNKKNIRYIGVDLPNVINEVKRISGDFNYQAADITNLNALRKIISKLEGRILIVTEAVLPYLTLSELKMVIANIRDILAEKPGIWLTADFQDADYAVAVVKAFLDSDEYEKLSQNVKQGKSVSEFSGKIPPCVIAGPDLLEENGFAEKKVPYLNEQIVRVSLTSLKPEVKQKICEQYIPFNMSVYYLRESDGEELVEERKKAPSHGYEDFSFICKQHETGMTFFLTGRLDTVTSPELLTFFEKYCDSSKSIVLDCANLEYISSAGLRVFLMMYRKNNEKVRIVNCGELVQEVLEQTGLYSTFVASGEK